MKKKKFLLWTIAIISIFLITSIVYSFLRDDDPYQYFTGLGDSFDISADDATYVFSYYKDGKEAIYLANADGTNVKQLTEGETERHHNPRFSHDSTKIVFLSKDADGINSLYTINSDGSNPTKLVSNKMHVSEATYSPADDTIYYIAMPADEFKKSEEETKEGYELYSIDTNGEDEKQLTNADYFSMNSLSVSLDGKEIYFSSFDGKEKFYSYSLEEGKAKESILTKHLPKDSYSPQLSTNGENMLYTAVSKESENKSLFEYELFLMDTRNGETQRLTNLKASVASPRFFHKTNKAAILKNTNWPNEPSKFDFITVDLGTKKLQTISFDIAKPNDSHRLIQMVNQLVNGITIAILYTVLVGLWSTYQYIQSKKSYLPVIISFCLSVTAFIASFVVTVLIDPWYGIAVAMISASLLGCTLIVFIYAFALRFFGKRKK
ncbi:DPP IV N-terminal domain-containing protein [Niallia sp. 01092]|uniref:DPP IV N-terminal domain-containing protein n=1 Tax=unclassified Niallia TaxID=2837522 RepID=UPI003FD05420